MPLMIYCTAALASFSDSVSYITFLFSEWSIKNQVTQSYSVSNVDEKWSKNHNDLMRSDRIIPPQSWIKVLMSAFHDISSAITL